MRAVLVLGGDVPDERDLARLDGADLVVASDGGAAHLILCGRFPHVIVGDMDSLPPAAEARAAASDVRIERHPRDKTETDGELALRHLLAAGAKEIALIGGHGGRSAMFLTHLRLLRTAAEQGVDAAMYGHGERLRVLLPGREYRFSSGAVLDLIALEAAVVDLVGFRYAGRGIELRPWSGEGVSNVAEDDARLSVQGGVVLVIEEGV